MIFFFLDFFFIWLYNIDEGKGENMKREVCGWAKVLWTCTVEADTDQEAQEIAVKMLNKGEQDWQSVVEIDVNTITEIKD